MTENVSAPLLSAAFWEAWAAKPHLATWPHRRLVDHFVKAFPRDASVLVVAAGNGVITRSLGRLRPDLKFTLSDLVVEPLEAAARSEPAGAYAIAPADLNVLPWPFEAKSFDVVMIGDVLEYLAEPASAIAEGVRIGRFLLEFVLPAEVATVPSPMPRWSFAPGDPWTLVERFQRTVRTVRVHHLKESREYAAFVKL